ncbi:MAG: glutamine amidotransferase, partial [Planctomycetaceae bacterium]
LLFTDGNSTDGPPIDAATRSSLPPVYPVLPPDTEVPPDLSITRASVSETVFEDAPVTIQAEVAAHGAFGDGVIVELRDEAAKLIEQSRHPISQGEPLAVRFQTRPEQLGLQFYTVHVRDAREPETVFEESQTSAEATLANNVRVVAVNREGRPYRVLYVGGRPNWEYRFLHRALRQDRQIELVALIRIARKEAKFDFRGREGESSNPLFRGFKKEGDEQTESYDEPVLIRQGTRDEFELRDGFPREKSQLFAYDAIILDDVEAAFFTHDQLSLIERFVAERGGGLMMLGGIDTFQQGGYARTPLADALPVYLDRQAAAAPAEGYRLTLTRDGWLQPWMRLRSNEPDEQNRLNDMPPFVSVTRVESVKPGARVMATLSAARSEPLPALVSQRYGAGRTLAVLIGDLWRWSLQRADGAEDDLGKAWRQSVRWIVSDIPQRLELETSRQNDGPQSAIHLTVRVRDREFQPQENADLKVTIVQPDGASIAVETEPSLKEQGMFTGSFVPRLAGGYRAEAQWNDAVGESPHSAVVGWTSNPAADEFRHIGVDRERMEALAETTGGEVVDIEDLEAFTAGLPLRRVPITETWTSPLWHRSWMLLLVLACLLGEWGFRRVRGLP